MSDCDVVVVSLDDLFVVSFHSWIALGSDVCNLGHSTELSCFRPSSCRSKWFRQSDVRWGTFRPMRQGETANGNERCQLCTRSSSTRCSSRIRSCSLFLGHTCCSGLHRKLSQHLF